MSFIILPALYDNTFYAFSSAYTPLKTPSSGLGDIILLAVVGMVIYAIYHTCLANTGTHTEYTDEHDTPSQGHQGGSRYRSSGYGGSYGNAHRQHYNTGGMCNNAAAIYHSASLLCKYVSVV